MIRSLILTFVVLSLCAGCANTATPVPSTPAEMLAVDEARDVARMCVPGSEFRLNASYMVMETSVRPDILFRRVNFECKGEGIEIRVKTEPPREGTETCVGVLDPSYVDPVPGILLLKDGQDDRAVLPTIYTRMGTLETVIRVLVENPCRDKVIPAKPSPTIRSVFTAMR